MAMLRSAVVVRLQKNYLHSARSQSTLQARMQILFEALQPILSTVSLENNSIKF